MACKLCEAQRRRQELAKQMMIGVSGFGTPTEIVATPEGYNFSDANAAHKGSIWEQAGLLEYWWQINKTAGEWFNADPALVGKYDKQKFISELVGWLAYQKQATSYPELVNRFSTFGVTQICNGPISAQCIKDKNLVGSAFGTAFDQYKTIFVGTMLTGNVKAGAPSGTKTLAQMLGGTGQPQQTKPGQWPAAKYGNYDLSNAARASGGRSSLQQQGEVAPPPYDNAKVQAALDKFLASQSAEDFYDLTQALGEQAYQCSITQNPAAFAEIIKAAPCFKNGCYRDVGAKLTQILCTPGWTYDGNCNCTKDSPKTGAGGSCTESDQCRPPLVCENGICTDPKNVPLPQPPCTAPGQPCGPGTECCGGYCENGKCKIQGEVGSGPLPACKSDADCPAGQVCVDGKCQPKPKPEEKQPVTWLWWLLAIVATGGVGTAIYLGTRDEGEPKPKSNPTGGGGGYVKRYIGDAVIHIRYVGGDSYEGKVVAGGKTWRFDGLNAPRAGFDFDSAHAYDAMAQSAVSFGSYYTTHNRGDDLPDWAPDPETADAIEEATAWAQDDQGNYGVRRGKRHA